MKARTLNQLINCFRLLPMVLMPWYHQTKMNSFMLLPRNFLLKWSKMKKNKCFTTHLVTCKHNKMIEHFFKAWNNSIVCLATFSSKKNLSKTLLSGNSSLFLSIQFKHGIRLSGYRIPGQHKKLDPDCVKSYIAHLVESIKMHR